MNSAYYFNVIVTGSAMKFHHKYYIIINTFDTTKYNPAIVVGDWRYITQITPFSSLYSYFINSLTKRNCILSGCKRIQNTQNWVAMSNQSAESTDRCRSTDRENLITNRSDLI